MNNFTPLAGEEQPLEVHEEVKEQLINQSINQYFKESKQVIKNK